MLVFKRFRTLNSFEDKDTTEVLKVVESGSKWLYIKYLEYYNTLTVNKLIGMGIWGQELQKL